MVDKPFFNNVTQHFHHRYCLGLCEAFLLQSLYKFKGVEVMIAGAAWCSMECALDSVVMEDAWNSSGWYGTAS